jgi:hypothetical protein
VVEEGYRLEDEKCWVSVRQMTNSIEVQLHTVLVE